MILRVMLCVPGEGGAADSWLPSPRWSPVTLKVSDPEAGGGRGGGRGREPMPF